MTSLARSSRSASRSNLWDDSRTKLLRPLLCALLFASAPPALGDVGRDETAAVAERLASVARSPSSTLTSAVSRRGAPRSSPRKGKVRVVIVDAASGERQHQQKHANGEQRGREQADLVGTALAYT
jgi:hypothetical protein